MAEPEDDDDIDLGISLEKVATVVTQARAVQAGEEGELDALDEEDAEEHAGPEDSDDITEDSFAEYVDGLNADEQTALIALAWVGRGDFDSDEWEEALRLAAERNETGDAGGYLLGLDMVGDLIAEGVAAFGLSIEDL
jgi:hypothetical protein